LNKANQITIVTLLKSGVSQREIERKTNINRKTIRKYAKILEKYPEKFDIQNTPPWPPANSSALQSTPEVATGINHSACDPHKNWIEKQVKLGRNAMAIYQDLIEQHNFENGYNSVKRFVRKFKVSDPKQYDRLEFLPGEEAQVDYGEGARTLYLNSNKYRRPRLFVMTLKYSRRSFRKTVWKSSKKVWAQLHEEAFRYFGGCPQYVVLDNLKEGVLIPDIYEPELNPLYQVILAHYGVVADPARVRDPDRKGTVENAIKHTQDTALKGRKFETIEEQNEWLLHWEERWASQRIHGRTKRQVEEMFQEEKPSLKKLPLMPFSYFEQERRTVWDDGLIQVGQCYYSAIPAPIYSEVVIRIYDLEIEILSPKDLSVIKRHRRNFKAGSVALDDADRIFNPSRQTNSILKKAALIGPMTQKLCETIFNKEGRPGQRKMMGLLSLTKKYQANHIEQASTDAITNGISKLKVIKKLVEQRSQKNNKEKHLPVGELTQEHNLIRLPSEYATFWSQHAVSGASEEDNENILNFKRKGEIDHGNEYDRN
jgi:transposase